MDATRIMYPCISCGRQFQFGPDRYDGRVAKLYGNAPVCNTCWNANFDGWGPSVNRNCSPCLRKWGFRYPLVTRTAGFRAVIDPASELSTGVQNQA